MAPFLLSATCLLLLLAGSVASELAHAPLPCIPVTEVLDRGLVVDDSVCPVSNNQLRALEETASDNAKGKLLVALAHYSRNDEGAFYRWLEETVQHVSSHPSGNSSIMQEAVHLMAYYFNYFTDSPDSARHWYQLCLDIDENHKQCLNEAAVLLNVCSLGKIKVEEAAATAWLLSRKALGLYFADFAAKDGSSFGLPCSVAIEGARSALLACRNGPEEIYTPAKIYLAMYLIDIADAVCDKATLHNIVEVESVVSLLKDMMVDLFVEGDLPDRNVHCITKPITTEEEIMDSILLSNFHHNSHLCEFSQEDNTTIVNEMTGSGDLNGTVSSEGEVGILDRLSTLDHDEMPQGEDDIDTPHSIKLSIQMLYLLETHRPDWVVLGHVHSS